MRVNETDVGQPAPVSAFTALSLLLGLLLAFLSLLFLFAGLVLGPFGVFTPPVSRLFVSLSPFCSFGAIIIASIARKPCERFEQEEHP